MSYATPPFGLGAWPTTPGVQTPENTVKQAGLQFWNDDTGTFQMIASHAPWIQRGQTARFSFTISHVLDGAVTAFTAPLTATVLDRYRQPTIASYFTVGAVTANPTASNNFYVDVTCNTIGELDYFEMQWTGSYTPKAGAPALPFQVQHSFRVFSPGKPSKHYFYPTSAFGTHG